MLDGTVDGTLFGGYLAALADATAGHAMATTLGDQEGFATADLHISYHRPVRGGPLRFEGVVISRGRQIGHVEVRFTSQSGDLVATAHATEVVTVGARRRGHGRPSRAPHRPGWTWTGRREPAGHGRRGR